MSLSPPPPGIFGTRAELEQTARDWAANNGYAIVVRSSEQNRVVLKCDRGGAYRNRRNLAESDRRRKTGSTLTNCPFRAVGKMVAALNAWQLSVSVPEHNHEASISRAAHASLRRLNEEASRQLVSLTASHVVPRTIEAILRQSDQGEAIIRKDIYNARQRIRNIALNGRTPIQALVQQLRVEDFHWNLRTDAEGHVTHLFFAYRESLQLYQSFPEVLLIDCTYKTNRYHMPLCCMVGITGMNTSFIIAFAFLKREAEDDYNWVLSELSASVEGFIQPGVAVTDRDLAQLNALTHVFPNSKHLLCRWHIRKNVIARCWPFFKDLPTTSAGTAEQKWAAFLGDWDNLVASLSVTEYTRQLGYFKSRYRLHAFALQYVQTVWLNDHKERFVCAWVHQHRHLDTIVTSRVEGSHSLLKRYIGVSSFIEVIFPILTFTGCYRRPVEGLQ